MKQTPRLPTDSKSASEERIRARERDRENRVRKGQPENGTKTPPQVKEFQHQRNKDGRLQTQIHSHA